MTTSEVLTERKGGRARKTRESAIPRQRVLLAAARLFRERGYHATTVRDIAAGCGILSGSLFHHFASKEQMLAEILREAALTICTGAEALVAGITDPAARLRAVVCFELECFLGSRTRDYFGVLISEWRDVPAGLQPELRALRQRYFDLVLSVAEECEAAGLLRTEAQATVRVIHSTTTGAITWFRNDGRYTTDSFADVLCRLMLRGVD
ncbi:TetR/AcrR family transcriptional regulator [Variovorax sp. LjRoot175]|uniref:TetR/AcrR family transcriptional regulator n=1 Tax=Variovorax sp. LjRoot175 TaxID=3342276 RepID=UPI003ECDFA54